MGTSDVSGYSRVPGGRPGGGRFAPGKVGGAGLDRSGFAGPFPEPEQAVVQVDWRDYTLPDSAPERDNLPEFAHALNEDINDARELDGEREGRMVARDAWTRYHNEFTKAVHDGNTHRANYCAELLRVINHVSNRNFGTGRNA